MTDLSRIESQFNARFENWRIHLPPQDVAARRRGRIMQAGWTIWYLFASDDQGEYLDFYSYHRMAGDEHVRLRANGEMAALPSLAWAYSVVDDPQEGQAIEEDFYHRNQEVSAMLAAKGFGCQGDEDFLTQVNHQLVTRSDTGAEEPRRGGSA